MNEEQLRIISLDPGGGTGWMTHVLRPKGAEKQPFYKGCFMEDDHHLDLSRKLDVYLPHIIICEDFFYQIRKIKGEDGEIESPSIVLVSLEYIGVVKLWAQQHPNVKLVMRNPGQEFNVWTDDKLKKLSMYTSGSKKTNGAPHINDAARHLLGVLVGNLKRSDYLDPLRPVR